MGFLKEFKEFAVKGNMVDMAIGIIIGGAFGKVISSLVTDVIMPPVGLLIGGIDFSKIMIPLNSTININIGVFINTVIDFVIIALAIFIMIKQMNRLKKKEEAKPAAPAKPSEEVLLLRDIRNSLKKK
ncbi:large-conductance mechanosensitive channel protein MscL [Candidatus Woesearchaeota archaeon]|nr:large-conductance mechanosensitive channel protein MscL [Candidatus Woesearchaeota archaeon]